jgi:hypothetical protein
VKNIPERIEYKDQRKRFMDAFLRPAPQEIIGNCATKMKELTSQNREFLSY